MRLCKMARFCAFLRVFELFCAFLCVFSFPKWPATKRELAQNSAKMCKRRFYAIPPLVIPPFACDQKKLTELAARNCTLPNLIRPVSGFLEVLWGPRGHAELWLALSDIRRYVPISVWLKG